MAPTWAVTGLLLRYKTFHIDKDFAKLAVNQQQNVSLGSKQSYSFLCFCPKFAEGRVKI